MIPEGVPEEARRSMLGPEVMGPPIVFLASPEATGLSGARIVVKDFESFLADFRSSGPSQA